MLSFEIRTLGRRPLLACALGVGMAGLFAPESAEAHFTLQTPASWAQEDAAGSPQKSAPCGETDVVGTVQAQATNQVTSFRPGQTIAVTIDEQVFHPGHYRVALSVNNRSELPADPVVTAGATACGTAVTEATPVFPVLADNMLDHTVPFTAPQTFMVTLPTNVTCTKCTLQVIEFMSNHGLNNPGGCFYHHCADISILADGGTATTSDAGSPRDAATDGRVSTGVGGSTGNGGSTGTAGGAATGSGGAGSPTGAGGATSTGGAGGAPGTGGDVAGTGGTGVGGSTGTAGLSGGVGGSAPAAGGASTSDGSTGVEEPAPGDGGGCALSAAPRTSSAVSGAAGLLVLATFIRRRRRTP